MMTELQSLYDRYLNTLDNYAVGSGFQAIKSRLKKRAFQENVSREFIESLRSFFDVFKESEPDSDLVCQILRYMYTKPLDHWQDRNCCFVFSAVHAFTIDLIPYLTPEGAHVLYQEYDRNYEPRMRLPVQKEVVNNLQQKSTLSY